MANLNLEQDEVVIFHNEDARDVDAKVNGDLYLTNRHIIFIRQIKKGLFGKEKQVEKISLSDLRVYDGHPQIFEVKSDDEDDYCDSVIRVEFDTGNRSFEFNEEDEDISKKAVQQWINCLTILLTGHPVNDNGIWLGVGDATEPDNSAYAAYYFYNKAHNTAENKQATEYNSEKVEDTSFCPQCGRRITNGYRFCVNCGCEITQ